MKIRSTLCNAVGCVAEGIGVSMDGMDRMDGADRMDEMDAGKVRDVDEARPRRTALGPPCSPVWDAAHVALVEAAAFNATVTDARAQLAAKRIRTRAAGKRPGLARARYFCTPMCLMLSRRGTL